LETKIYSGMKNLRKSRTQLLDEGQSIQRRLDSLDKGGQYYIAGLGKAVLTPILMCVYPDKCGVYNRISEGVLIWLGAMKAKPKASLGKRYDEVNKACLEISRTIKRRPQLRRKGRFRFESNHDNVNTRYTAPTLPGCAASGFSGMSGEGP
jgi:hypothetical protein